MSFPQYPTYTDSQIEWLGPIPDHWSVLPLSAIAFERDEPNIGMMERNLLSLSYGNIVEKDINSADGLLPESFETYQIVQRDDVVWRLTDLQNDQRSLRTALSPVKGIITSAYLVTVPMRIHPGYFSHLMRAYDLTKVYYSMGGGLRQSMRFSDVKRLPVLIPPPDDQKLISDFLDAQCKRMDALIDEQKRLIDLLSEKRQAVISHAVAKGLNPDATMKDSGIEWLGMVPVHWEVSRIKWKAKMESGHTPDKKVEAYWVNCEIPWVSLHDTAFLKANDFITETAQYINPLGIENSSARLLPPNTVVFSRDATIGRCGITTRPMAVSQHFIAWVCGSELAPEYLLLCLRSMIQDLERLTFGATIKTIGMPDVRKLTIAVPPISEQLSIVSFVRKQVTDIDALVHEASLSLNILQERRSALISAAVTGKIDVRGLVKVDLQAEVVAA